jgi:LysR family glycine cleavage system transcriptional activator
MHELCSTIEMTASDRPSLDCLRTFATAARHGSFKDGARTLGVTPSAVSHRVRELEDWVGGPLFHRRVRQVTLTAAGRALSRRLDGAFTSIDAALERARSHRDETRLRITALPLFTDVWLIPRLHRFEAAFPELSIEIDTRHQVTDLAEAGVDVAIRNVAKPGPTLVARKLLDLRAVPMCTPSVARTVRSPADLGGATLIHLVGSPIGWREWFAAVGSRAPTPASTIGFDTLPAVLTAAAAGRGVMLGLDPIVWDAPAAAGLVTPFDVVAPGAGSYYVVCRRAERSRRHVRAFVDWLVDEMAADRRRLERTARDRRAGLVLRNDHTPAGPSAPVRRRRSSR